MHVLLSYPRSGNSWVRYAIEYITGRPTLGADQTSGKHGASVAAVADGLSHVDLGADPVLQKKHVLSSNIDLGRPMIFLVRDYHEAVMRHKYHKYRHTPPTTELDCWAEAARQFHECPHPKIMSRYEDIIGENQIDEIRRIIEFLPANTPNWDSFVENFDAIKEDSVNTYSKAGPLDVSQTRGRSKVYHANNMSEEDMYCWKNHLLTKYPQLDYIYRPYFKD